jgi:Glyoxalase-like domain
MSRSALRPRPGAVAACTEPFPPLVVDPPGPLLPPPRRGGSRRSSGTLRAPLLTPPRWPDPDHPQQEHLDIRVDDVDAAERAVVDLGATRLPAGREEGFRVFADPAGHPFCLVFG